MDYKTAEKRLNELDALGSRLARGFEDTPFANHPVRFASTPPREGNCEGHHPAIHHSCLAPMRELMRRLGDPQDGLKIVHVAGTNGKGSVIAYLDSVARAAHLKSGAYTSPCLEDFKENIRVGGIEISETEAAEHLSKIFEAADAMAADGFSRPTRFETETALAFLHFSAKSCEIVLLETGMGGRDDATNIIKKPLLTILTSISLDHTQVLGNTIEEIAKVKCGIIKSGVPCVSAVQEPGVLSVIEKHCAEINAALTVAERERVEDLWYKGWETGGQTFSWTYVAKNGVDFIGDVEVSQYADYQLFNAITAIEAAQILGFEEEPVKQGLKSATWFGRLSVLHEHPLFIIDGAHNPAGVESLFYSLIDCPPFMVTERIVGIVGIFRDKDAESILETAARFVDKIIIVDMPENKRLLRAEELAEIAWKCYKDVYASIGYKKDAYRSSSFKKDVYVYASTSPQDAVREAFASLAGKNDVIIAFGSLSIVKPVEKAVKDFQEKTIYQQK